MAEHEPLPILPRFIIGGQHRLPLHELPSHGTGGYYLGMFLGGAYQEALRVMQHEPEVMFEVLKQRTDDGATASALARTFGAMSYLWFDSQASLESSGMSSDSEGSATCAAEDDDDAWEFMRGAGGGALAVAPCTEQSAQSRGLGVN